MSLGRVRDETGPESGARGDQEDLGIGQAMIRRADLSERLVAGRIDEHDEAGGSRLGLVEA